MFGAANDKFYSIVTWVNGTIIMDIVKKDVSKSYYQLGKKVGKELQKLHSSCRISSRINWQDVIKKRQPYF